MLAIFNPTAEDVQKYRLSLADFIGSILEVFSSNAMLINYLYKSKRSMQILRQVFIFVFGASQLLTDPVNPAKAFLDDFSKNEWAVVSNIFTSLSSKSFPSVNTSVQLYNLFYIYNLVWTHYGTINVYINWTVSVLWYMLNGDKQEFVTRLQSPPQINIKFLGNTNWRFFGLLVGFVWLVYLGYPASGFATVNPGYSQNILAPTTTVQTSCLTFALGSFAAGALNALRRVQEEDPTADRINEVLSYILLNQVDLNEPGPGDTVFTLKHFPVLLDENFQVYELETTLARLRPTYSKKVRFGERLSRSFRNNQNNKPNKRRFFIS